MPLRIAFDLDGVFADMEGELVRQARVLFGKAITCRQRDLTIRQQRRLWRRVESMTSFWESLPESEPSVLRRLATIAKQRRWEVIFITTRPEGAGAGAQVQSQRWLESKGFPLPSVYVVPGSRGCVAAALELDIVVDDHPKNCLDVVLDSTAQAILVWRAHGQPLPPVARRRRITVVRSVEECLEVLLRADALQNPEPRASKPRVRR